VAPPIDEIGMLSSAFNRMTGRLQEQTGALVAANEQLDTRRAFIEAVLSSVTAGVIALDEESRILLVNRSAEGLLQPEGQELEGRGLNEGLRGTRRIHGWRGPRGECVHSRRR
jgi:two-component system nitrogen regulation sensor histidine kinase NtrY